MNNYLIKTKIAFFFLIIFFGSAIFFGFYYNEKVESINIWVFTPLIEKNLTNLFKPSKIVDYTQQNYSNCEFQVQKNTIILRLDDIAAWSYKDISRDMVNEVLERNMSISLGVIPEYLEKDKNVIKWLNTLKYNPHVEIALHGYDHDENEFMNLTKDEAVEKITKGKNKFEDSLGVIPITFIPPYNEYSSAVKEALIEENFKIFSAKQDEYEVNDIISLGYNARTYDYYTYRFVPVDEVLESCKNSLRERGICVVMLHPQDYLVAEGSSDIDYDKYNEFLKLLDGLEELNADFKAFKDVLDCTDVSY